MGERLDESRLFARLVDTRRLRVLYSQFHVAADGHDLLQGVVCEQERLSRIHGSRVAARSIEFADEEVWRTPGEKSQAENSLIRRRPAAGAIEVNEKRCGQFPALGPDSVAGVHVNREPIRPVPPIRPSQ